MSVYKRLCVGIRTHKFGDAEQDLYRSLTDYFAQNEIFLVVDETQGAVDVPPIYNKIGFNKDSLSQLSLFGEYPKIGWLCGDYFYYFLYRHVRADGYWLVEPDVRFTFDRVDEFFKLFEQDGADLLLTNFGPRRPHWHWYNLGLRISDSVYGCAFPISRLSGQAIELLLKERQAISLKLAEQNGTWQNYPNDEAFVATTAMKIGLNCADLVGQHGNLFTHFSVLFPYLWPDAKKVIPKGKVVHPALVKSEFWPAFNSKAYRAINKSDLRKLLSAASAGMDTQDRERMNDSLLNVVADWIIRNGFGKD